MRARLNEYEHVTAWEVWTPKDEPSLSKETQDEAIAEAKKLAQAERLRATWHSRVGALVGEVDYSTVFSRSKEVGHGEIEKALKQGYRLYADCSGSGLRIVSVERTQATKVGEKNKVEMLASAAHFSLECALMYVAEDLKRGKKLKRTQYWTGSGQASGKLDEWVLQGRRMEVYAEGEEIVCKLSGLVHETKEVEGKRDMVFGTLSKLGRGKDFFEASASAVAERGVFVSREVESENVIDL